MISAFIAHHEDRHKQQKVINHYNGAIFQDLSTKKEFEEINEHNFSAFIK
jgi:hypothetical protein